LRELLEKMYKKVLNMYEKVLNILLIFFF